MAEAELKTDIARIYLKCHEVFDLPELFEMVLAQMTLKDIICCRGVNKSWTAVINRPGSNELTQALWMQSVDRYSLLNWHDCSTPPPAGSSRPDLIYFHRKPAPHGGLERLVWPNTGPSTTVVALSQPVMQARDSDNYANALALKWRIEDINAAFSSQLLRTYATQPPCRSMYLVWETDDDLIFKTSLSMQEGDGIRLRDIRDII